MDDLHLKLRYGFLCKNLLNIRLDGVSICLLKVSAINLNFLLHLNLYLVHKASLWEWSATTHSMCLISCPPFSFVLLQV